MSLQAAFRQCLAEGDVRGMRRLSAEIAPHEPQPKDDAQAEVALHMARTQMESLPLRARAWSHRWLTERAYPSQLPDLLRPAAERIYANTVQTVGIAIKASPHRREQALAARSAMETVVQEMFADGDRDPVLVSQQMLRARMRVLRTA